MVPSTVFASRRPHQGDDADSQREKSPRGGAPALGPRARPGTPRAGHDRVGGRAAAAGPLAWGRRQEAQTDSGPEPCPAKARTKRKPLMSIERRMRGRVHYGWIVVGVTFVTLLAAAGIRSAPGVLDDPARARVRVDAGDRVVRGLHQPVPLRSVRAVHRWADGPTRHPRVMVTSLALVATGVALTTLMTASWQLAFAVGRGGRTRHRHHGIRPRGHVANRWFTERRGVVLGLLTASSATGSFCSCPCSPRWWCASAGEAPCCWWPASPSSCCRWWRC